MTKEQNKIFSDIAWKWINKNLKQNKKIAIIVNKKWYSSGIICNECWYIPKCENCDVSIAYHINLQWNFFWLCHICKRHYNPIWQCPNCQSTQINTYWYWIEKIHQTIKKNFWADPFIIESKNTNSYKKASLAKQKMQNKNIIIWTSILGKTKNIKFDLVIFLNADLGLNIPDFNSSYRNFLFLYESLQILDSKNFLVQSFATQNHSIRYACEMNIEKFKDIELQYRKDFEYPPFKKVCKILYKNEIEQKLFEKVDTLYKELLFLKEKYDLSDIQIYSTPPMIYKMFWKYRYNIILKWDNLKNFMDIAYSKLKIQQKWFKIDREPENIVN